MSTAQMLLQTTPSTEEEWRRTLALEAAGRVMEPAYVGILQALLKEMEPQTANRVYALLTDGFQDAVGLAVAMMEALRSMHATPETDSDADVEGKLAVVAAAGMAGWLEEYREKVLSRVTDLAVVRENERQDKELAERLYEAGERASGRAPR